MPVSIADVKKAIAQKFDLELINQITDTIDGKLSDTTYLKNNRCGTPETGYSWMFTHPGELSQNEIKHIQEGYRVAGWRCEVSNSADGGERAGMIGIKLQMPPEGPVKRGG